MPYNAGVAPQSLTAAQRAALRTALLGHYLLYRRTLPWRETRDPYRIWVSEVMLQQTRVETVVPRYTAFLARFPTLAALADADEHDVLAAWAGLGYYRRARHLHAAARQVVAQHGGRLPETAQALRTLAGFGAYTAGAVASIAFGEATPLVDGNVARVLARLMAIDEPPDRGAGRRQVWALAAELVAGPTPGDLNQALMELGARICRPRQPACGRCPWRWPCRARAQGRTDELPRPPAAVVRRPLSMAFALADGGSQGRQAAWLWRRPLGGLWAGLWEPPSATGPDAAAALARALGQPLGAQLATVRHELTHREVSAVVYRVARARWPAHDTLRLFAQPLEAPLSALARRVIVAGQAALDPSRSASLPLARRPRASQ